MLGLLIGMVVVCVVPLSSFATTVSDVEYYQVDLNQNRTNVLFVDSGYEKLSVRVLRKGKNDNVQCLGPYQSTQIKSPVLSKKILDLRSSSRRLSPMSLEQIQIGEKKSAPTEECSWLPGGEEQYQEWLLDLNSDPPVTRLCHLRDNDHRVWARFKTPYTEDKKIVVLRWLESLILVAKPYRWGMASRYSETFFVKCDATESLELALSHEASD